MNGKKRRAKNFLMYTLTKTRPDRVNQDKVEL